MKKIGTRDREPSPERHRDKRTLYFSLFKIVLVALLLWLMVAGFYYAWACTFDLSKVQDMQERSIILDRDGKYFARLTGDNRAVVPFDKVSNHFVNALISREDTRFYNHKGIDPIGLIRAVVRNLFLGGFSQGGSTLTQQLAKNSFELREKNLNRKAIEAALAFRIEDELTKEEILEAYMNRIFFGFGTWGIEAASQTYFGKPAANLNLQESATLAALIRSPNNIAHFKDPDRSIRERNTVLGRMLDLGFITRLEYDEAAASPLVAMPLTKTSPEKNWAVDAILMELDLVLEPDQMEDGGLIIHSTIDRRIQTAAEESVSRRLTQTEALPGYPHKPKSAFKEANLNSAKSTPYLEAAAIAMDNSTGGIRAIVGGRDYSRSKFHRALFSKRQAGSVVKPFVYAAAFEAGVLPNEPVSDDRIQPGEIPRNLGSYNPANSDGTYKGMLPAGEGLVQSRNTMSVRLGLRAGLDRIADTIKRAEISTGVEPYPSICLGSFEAGLKDLTAAYTIFSTGGVRLQPYLIDRVLDADGKILYQSKQIRRQVLSPSAAKMTSGFLEEAVSRGTAAGARRLGLTGYGAGKTGTTNNYVDAWFVGFDKKLTCGVWVGFDSPKSIMPGGYGSALALPIWVDIVQASKSGP